MRSQKTKLIYPQLSYTVTGVLFFAHNTLGRFAKEKQYCDLVESKFQEKKINARREFLVKNTGNRVDFIIEDKIIVEVKAIPFVTHKDYYQIQ